MIAPPPPPPPPPPPLPSLSLQSSLPLKSFLGKSSRSDNFNNNISENNSLKTTTGACLPTQTQADDDDDEGTLNLQKRHQELVCQEDGRLHTSLIQVIPRPKSKMKSLNWSKIPAQRVMTTVISNTPDTTSSSFDNVVGSGRLQMKKNLEVNQTNSSLPHNLWSLLATTKKKEEVIETVDFDLLEGWFCQPMPKSAPNSNPGSPMIQRRVLQGSHACINDLNSSRREAKREGNGETSPPVNILDRQKTLNVNIFLKQYREPIEEIISMIREGDYMYIGSEGLTSLMKLLPNENEVQELLKNSMYVDRMPVAEKFLLLLIQIPRYELRIECMLFKEEFESMITYLEPSIDVVKSAAKELQESEGLREVLYLILVSGNFLNSGGYAGNAAGFSIMSLLKLPDIRANKPGVSFIHFLAQQTEQKPQPNASEFYLQLPSLDEASKIAIDALKADVEALGAKISSLKKQLQEDKKSPQELETKTKETISSPIDITDEVFFRKMYEFVIESEREVSRIEKCIKEDLEETRVHLARFLCEDERDFKLEESFRIISTFCHLFKTAQEENRKRKETEKRLEARRMIQVHHQQQQQILLGQQQKKNSLNRQKHFNRPSSLELTAGPVGGDDDALIDESAIMLFEFLRSSSSEGPGNEGNLFGASLRRSGRKSRGWRDSRDSCIEWIEGRERHPSQETVISVQPHTSFSSFEDRSETNRERESSLSRNSSMRRSRRRNRSILLDGDSSSSLLSSPGVEVQPNLAAPSVGVTTSAVSGNRSSSFSSSVTSRGPLEILSSSTSDTLKTNEDDEKEVVSHEQVTSTKTSSFCRSSPLRRTFYSRPRIMRVGRVLPSIITTSDEATDLPSSSLPRESQAGEEIPEQQQEAERFQVEIQLEDPQSSLLQSSSLTSSCSESTDSSSSSSGFCSNSHSRSSRLPVRTNDLTSLPRWRTTSLPDGNFRRTRLTTKGNQDSFSSSLRLPYSSHLRYQTPLPKTSLVMRTTAQNAFSPVANFRRASVASLRKYSPSSSTGHQRILVHPPPSSSAFAFGSRYPSSGRYPSFVMKSSYRKPSATSSSDLKSFMKQTSSSAAKAAKR